jgi:hypothetical protein
MGNCLNKRTNLVNKQNSNQDNKQLIDGKKNENDIKKDKDKNEQKQKDDKKNLSIYFY